MDFRQQYLPYCLIRQEDGRYAVLNRRYKPLGFNTTDWVTCSEYPVLSSIKGIDAPTAARLSWNASGGVSEIFLYNDGCIPTQSPEHMAAYLDRLAILAALKTI